MIIERFPKNPLSYLSHSKLSKFIQSPWAFATEYILGRKKKSTYQMDLGKKIHLALLEPKAFLERFVVIPKFQGVGSRKAKAEFIEKLPKDSVYVTEEERQNIEWQLDSLISHPLAMKMIQGGLPEQKILVSGKELGTDLDILAIPDLVTRHNEIIDFKTTSLINLMQFNKDVYYRNYWTQLSLYRYALSKETGKKEALIDCWILLSQTVSPWDCVVMPVEFSIVDYGRDKLLRVIESLSIKLEQYDTYFTKTNTRPQDDIIKLRELFPGINDDKLAPVSFPSYIIDTILSENQEGE